jgi:two-component system, chemotaxis family, CheB/CheR fusion protein
MEDLEQQVAERVQLLNILQDVAMASNQARTIEEAVQRALARICDYNRWLLADAFRLTEDADSHVVSLGEWYINDDLVEPAQRKQLEKFQQSRLNARYGPGEGSIGRVLSTGEPQWIEDTAQTDGWRHASPADYGLRAAIAFPVVVNDEVVAVLECFSDRTIDRDLRFMEVMQNVGIQLGHVVRRQRLERRIAETAEHEQRRIGSDIHDGLGQELTGLRYLAQTHYESLTKQDSPDTKIAARLSTGLETVQKQLRSIVRDLIPVELDGKGLEAALSALAERTTATTDMACQLHIEQPLELDDIMLATQIYRIVQEAVSNSARHAAGKQVDIYLRQFDNQLELRVVDDGDGIETDPLPDTGLGLRNMHFRAALIGANLTFSPGENGGTVVHCRLPLKI